MCRDGIKRFKTIAVIAATAIGDPSKYWIICGAALVTLLGKRTRAKVKMIGKPMMYRSDSPVCCWRMTFNPLSMIVTVMIAKTPDYRRRNCRQEGGQLGEETQDDKPAPGGDEDPLGGDPGDGDHPGVGRVTSYRRRSGQGGY